MAIVPTDAPITAAQNAQLIKQLTRTYPYIRSEILITTVFRRPVPTLVIGNGPRKVIFSAAHHANEWITSLILLKFA